MTNTISFALPNAWALQESIPILHYGWAQERYNGYTTSSKERIFRLLSAKEG